MDDTDDDDARYPYAHTHPHTHNPPLQYHYNYQYHPSYINTTTNTPNPPFHRPKLPLRTAPAPPFSDEDEDDEENNNYDDEDEEEVSSENHLPEPQQSDTRGKLPQESVDAKPVFDRFGVRTLPPKFFSHKDPADDWSETATLILLETWREKFLQSGKRSLRPEQWVEIAKRVSAGSKTFRTDAHCRNRFETLKKKYKREKSKQIRGFGVSKWAYFRQMDSLVSPPHSHVGLQCGLDGGEYVFLNPRVYLAQSSFDDLSDSPAEEDDDVDEEDGRAKRFRGSDDEDCFRVLADSIKRFGEIYERIESNKRQGMLDLEKMRKEIDGDLEAQKSQILEQTKVALAKIWQGGGNANNDDIDASVTNMSG